MTAKYAQNKYETWADRCHTVINSVCGDVGGTKNKLMDKADAVQVAPRWTVSVVRWA